ncbi:hypothetical protein PAXRUDRAFT_17564 [Paxillus rubicundulus Ve08.2h10]|uniref:Uncharacterized protein n=1 Tax=Paxillus rubicundulus Ve08.2h10 TaxID=930991 RepID=A0A0D0D1C0_9AGAM|nr:hypothetical protein PAXRUDRAFT_17564 [Paxillus rubicundulus Ve08.2h10]
MARDLFKTQLLINARFHSAAIWIHPNQSICQIIWVMVFGKGILSGKKKGGLMGQGQKLGMLGSSAGLISVAVTFAWYLLSNDCELATVGEESSLTYQDNFEYFFELLSNPEKQEWALEVMNFINEGVWNKPHQPSANATPHTSATAKTPLWESNILAQLNGPLTQSQQHTPPHNPCCNSELMDTADGGVFPLQFPEELLQHQLHSSYPRHNLIQTQPSISTHHTNSRELSAAARHGGRVVTILAVDSEDQMGRDVGQAQEATLGPTKGHQNPHVLARP